MDELKMAVKELREDFANKTPLTQQDAKNHASLAAQQCLQVMKGRPIKIAKALKALGFQIWDRDFDGDKATSGVMAINATKEYPRAIGVNVADSYEHQRFTLAHELGHFIFDAPLDPGREAIFVIQYNTEADNENNLIEYRVNKFAAYLLMPEFEFREMWAFLSRFKELKEIGTKTIAMAALFDVPVTAARRRVMELGL